MNYQLETPTLWGWVKLAAGLLIVSFIYVCVVVGVAILLSKLNILFQTIESFFNS